MDGQVRMWKESESVKGTHQVETRVQVCDSDPCQPDKFVAMKVVNIGCCEDGCIAIAVVAVTGKVWQSRHWQMKGELWQLSCGERWQCQLLLCEGEQWWCWR